MAAIAKMLESAMPRLSAWMFMIPSGPFVSLFPVQLFQSEKPGRVLPANALSLLVADRQLVDRLEHQRDAADLMRVVAAGQNVIGACEVDRKLQRNLIEIDCVVVELLQIGARRTLNLRAAVLEVMEAAIEPFDEIGYGAAEVTERPFDVGEALGYTVERQRSGGERRVVEKSDQRHEPEFSHHVDVHRMLRVDIHHRADLVGGLV